MLLQHFESHCKFCISQNHDLLLIMQARYSNQQDIHNEPVKRQNAPFPTEDRVIPHDLSNYVLSKLSNLRQNSIMVVRTWNTKASLQYVYPGYETEYEPQKTLDKILTQIKGSAVTDSKGVSMTLLRSINTLNNSFHSLAFLYTT